MRGRGVDVSQTLFYCHERTKYILRREDDYCEMSPNERRSILTKLFYFTVRCDIKYKCFLYEKREYSDVYKLQARMARDMSQFMKDNIYLSVKCELSLKIILVIYIMWLHVVELHIYSGITRGLT